MILKKSRWVIATLTAIHLALSVGLMVFTFSTGMDRFDSGAPPSLMENLALFFSNVLFWPIVYPLTHWAPSTVRHVFGGVLGYFPILLNSLIWGGIGERILHRYFWNRHSAKGKMNG